jgi:hypothetical protein
VRYRLTAEAGQHETARRVLGFHADNCPVARTLRGCVDITTELETTT